MKECQLCKKCYADDVIACSSDGMPTAHTIAGEPVLEGKYHLESRVGQGGMGIVYKARHAYLKTLHAIKIILPDLVGNDPQLVTRFRQEALAAAAIRHQNVVGVSDYGVISGTLPFLVMEYVEGESLHDLLGREKKLSPEHALELMTAVCAGVGAAHHQGIVHRDLKPLNIMICSDRPSIAESVKILDFGLAKIKSGELLGSFIQAQTTGLMGSPYYMAPEQWSDDDLDSRSDIYSLGVMLFQMLSGEVPFKGSSIPAIMKKHISDKPPTFAEIGLNISPELEKAVHHTLEKDPKLRTSTVEIMVRELREAIMPGAQTLPNAAPSSLPVSSLSILTRPAQATVFIDNVAVGNSRNDGWLMLEGIQSGNHRLRVSHNGFDDWHGDVVCDGKPMSVVAELQTVPPPDVDAIPRPKVNTIPPPVITGNIPPPRPDLLVTQSQAKTADHTINQPWETGQQDVSVVSTPEKKGFFSPLVLGIIGICTLLLLGIGGFGAAYMAGWVGGTTAGPGASPTPVASPGQTPAPQEFKADMVAIPGGTFKMGSNTGDQKERPEHPIKVESFQMDKTEVTNGEYYEFVKSAGYSTPNHWVNGAPVKGTEKMPVTFVSQEDAKAFAKWRSTRDGVTYRLPTEAEWEYAARNGEKGNTYPWGNEWNPTLLVMDVKDSEPAMVGSKPAGQNSWGVLDLMGNVWEWTSDEITSYPGSAVKLKVENGRVVVRGGSAHENPEQYKITATYRADIEPDLKQKNLGFRLVRSG